MLNYLANQVLHKALDLKVHTEENHLTDGTNVNDTIVDGDLKQSTAIKMFQQIGTPDTNLMTTKASRKVSKLSSWKEEEALG